MSDFFVYQFSRDRVEAGDFSHFLGMYGLDALPTGQPLAALMNAFTFTVDGYNDHPDELHSIPAVREFYGAFHRAWPYWLYFCNLNVDTLTAMTMCCLPSINAMQVDGKANVAVTCEPLDQVNFIKHDFMPMNLMCEQARMSERGIYVRTKAVFEYFRLPFDAEPPE